MRQIELFGKVRDQKEQGDPRVGCRCQAGGEPGVVSASPFLGLYLWSQAYPDSAAQVFPVRRDSVFCKATTSIFKQPLLLGNGPYMESENGVGVAFSHFDAGGAHRDFFMSLRETLPPSCAHP